MTIQGDTDTNQYGNGDYSPSMPDFLISGVEMDIRKGAKLAGAPGGKLRIQAPHWLD
jgi:hypothetical protein